MPKTPAQPGAKRVRRSPETVRGLLLDAAVDVFARRGYAGTTTREIALRAEVSEGLLFRHFGTKAVLFEEAVVRPFARYLDDYVDRWIAAPAASIAVVELTAEYIGGLYDLLRDRREVVLALLAANEHEAELDGVVTDAIATSLKRVEALTTREATARGYSMMDPHLASRTFFATVMGMAVLDRWYDRPGEPRPSRDAIVTEMTTMLVYGLENRGSGERS
ncbi:TetR/AcrR family transcriptional regulator [Sporichthya sp.]|uniref:TetR/AcrR family transcriptional regulator n=1 Tax=Sporichthya sp. TaxID=65475 RepID=UPI001815648C|nr:TetR/AcrR family transcriptional regulator [Sporichthya sp.]MBA3741842.1 TetR/AcrR family transcriptional regulator [Sporichthya sp.]